MPLMVRTLLVGETGLSTSLSPASLKRKQQNGTEARIISVLHDFSRLATSRVIIGLMKWVERLACFELQLVTYILPFWQWQTKKTFLRKFYDKVQELLFSFLLYQYWGLEFAIFYHARLYILFFNKKTIQIHFKIYCDEF